MFYRFIFLQYLQNNLACSACSVKSCPHRPNDVPNVLFKQHHSSYFRRCKSIQKFVLFWVTLCRPNTNE